MVLQQKYANVGHFSRDNKRLYAVKMTNADGRNPAQMFTVTTETFVTPSDLEAFNSKPLSGSSDKCRRDKTILAKIRRGGAGVVDLRSEYQIQV